MPTERHRRAAVLAGAATLGAVGSLSAAWPALWPLGLLALGGLATLVRRAAPGRAALAGWAFGGGWLLAATWWLYISMHRYGGLPAGLAALAVLLLALALAAYLAAAMALFARGRRGHAGADAALFATAWLGAELARGLLFTGFPWAAAGYGQVDGPLAAALPWVGVYGAGALAAGLVAWPLLGTAALRTRVMRALVAVGMLALLPLAGRDFTQGAGTLGVTLLQTHVAQDEKFAPERLPEALAWLAQALHGARGPLVVAPETAIPLLPDQLGPAGWDALVAPFRDGPRAALVGLPLGSFEVGYTNSVAGLARAAAAQPGGFYRYDKQHLVPFGEFIPPGFRWFVERMNIPLGDFARGPRVPPSFEWGGQRIGPNICYEDLFGEELARRFVAPGDGPTILANVSNIGWFGDTIAVAQHLHISRARSLELQRPMIRATNTGATAVIDHRGRVTAQLAPFTRGTLDAVVEGRRGVTPYARWAGSWGLAPLAALAVLAAVLLGRWRRPGP